MPDRDPPTEGLSEADLATAGKMIQEFGGGYEVGHSAPFWIIDKKGMIRIGMDASATPSDIVTDLRALSRLP
jgi:cytochrome oxidase Cu insertion factor (SCO1/SenC/PrrC family)